MKGIFWKHYSAKTDVPMEMSYSLPDGYSELYAYDAVLLANVDLGGTALAARKMLRDYVEDGGRLVLLGGCFSLGQGGVVGSFIEDILPVACKEQNEVVRCTPPILLGPEKGKPWPDSPALFWRHEVTPRGDAAILAWAGDLPIASAGKFGKGYALVFAGTTLGEGDAACKPFWETASWAGLFQRMLGGKDAP